MSQQLPASQDVLIADPFDFARRGAVVDGEVDARSFGRLADVLEDGAGLDQRVRYHLQGLRQDDKLFIVLQLEGAIGLGCQRCLQAVPHVLESENRLMLLAEGEALPDEALEDDSCDPINVGHNFDVLAAVEDEILLSLPISPMHDSCETPEAAVAKVKDSPFAVLAQLKSDKGSK
ncbi:YceD family protein [Uliginosibacterium sp. H1]|uniref:YceD family protein n=1 Tax=Uliginosibacterium sp. H1 TaxID=3114757 RepID=UPI002E181535|nr:YceD family protein [Uliginosibacterium sp. H1]